MLSYSLCSTSCNCNQTNCITPFAHVGRYPHHFEVKLPIYPLISRNLKHSYINCPTRPCDELEDQKIPRSGCRFGKKFGSIRTLWTADMSVGTNSQVQVENCSLSLWTTHHANSKYSSILANSLLSKFQEVSFQGLSPHHDLSQL